MSQIRQKLETIKKIAQNELKKDAASKRTGGSAEKLITAAAGGWININPSAADFVLKEVDEAWEDYLKLRKRIFSEIGLEAKKDRSGLKDRFRTILLAIRLTDYTSEELQGFFRSEEILSSGQKTIEAKDPGSVFTTGALLTKELFDKALSIIKGTSNFSKAQIIKTAMAMISYDMEIAPARSVKQSATNKGKLIDLVLKKHKASFFVFYFKGSMDYNGIPFAITVPRERLKEYVLDFPHYFVIVASKDPSKPLMLAFEPGANAQFWRAGTLDRPFSIHHERPDIYYNYRGFLNKDDTELLKRNKINNYNVFGWTAQDINSYNSFIESNFKNGFDEVHSTLFGSTRYKP